VTVVAEVLQRQHCLLKTDLQVFSYVAPQRRTKESPALTAHLPPASIEVLDIDATMFSEEILRLYFESTKKSGGGMIKSFEMIAEERKALITFDDPIGLLLILNKSIDVSTNH
jgi:hypothetical protein